MSFLEGEASGGVDVNSSLHTFIHYRWSLEFGYQAIKYVYSIQNEIQDFNTSEFLKNIYEISEVSTERLPALLFLWSLMKRRQNEMKSGLKTLLTII